jgi:hypothetical protein
LRQWPPENVASTTGAAIIETPAKFDEMFKKAHARFID